MSFSKLPGTLILRMIADDVFNTENQTQQKLNNGDMIRVVWNDGKWTYERIEGGTDKD